MKKQILFVDDEVNVLSGLRRMLRGQRDVWDMHFACGGEEAMAILQQQQMDVIVSDMRMPRMDGAELLGHVARLYPQTIRLILSGQSEQEKIFRAIGPAHQFLTKPCDPDLLVQTIDRAVGLHAQFQDESLKRITSKITSLPSLPRIYRDLVYELQSDNASMERVAKMIESDLAMSVKVLQLVNSSFFGLPSHVTSPKHAAALLGLGIIRPLTLTASVFLQYEDLRLPGFCLDREIRHGMSVGVAARQVAQCETQDQRMIDDTFIAGMMHDIGKLILAVHQRESFEAALSLSKLNKQPLWQSETEIYGTTHAAVGAHLLGLWGLPNPIVEAVAFHHQPELANSAGFSPLTAVHVADLLVAQGESDTTNCDETLLATSTRSIGDSAYLKSIHLDEHIEQWRNAVVPGSAS